MANFGVSTAAVICLFTALAGLTVGLRLYTRLGLLRTFGLDDAIIVWSLILNLVVSVMYSYSVTLGTGQHIDQLSPDQAEHAVMIEVITNSILDQTFAWPKLSIVILLIRVFEPRRAIRVTGYCLAVLSIIFSCLITIFNYAQCKPASAFWNHNIEAECWPPSVFSNYSIGVCSYNAALDLTLALYPTFVLRRLNMNLRRKISLSCLLGLGVVACVAAIIKVVQLSRLSSHSDLTYTFANIDLWNMIEANLMIVAACIPTLGPLWRTVKPTAARSEDTTIWPSSRRFRRSKAHKQLDSQLLSVGDEERNTSTLMLNPMPGKPGAVAVAESGVGIAIGSPRERGSEDYITVTTDISVTQEKRGRTATRGMHGLPEEM